MNIQDLKSNTTWQEASNTINNNNNKISLAITTLENATLKNRGYFTSVEKLKEAVPNPTIGSKAYVGTSEPYAIYIVENGAWVDSGYTGGDEIVAKITTDRIEDGAVTSEKIATSAFDPTLSVYVSGKIAPAEVVGYKFTNLESTTRFHSNAISKINAKLDEHTESINSKITTDRIEDGAVTSEKIATSAFDDTLSISGKIAPADVVGEKLSKLEKLTNPSFIDYEPTEEYIKELYITGENLNNIVCTQVYLTENILFAFYQNNILVATVNESYVQKDNIYIINEINNSGISGYLILKSTTATSFSGRNYNLFDTCFDLKYSPSISAFIAAQDITDKTNKSVFVQKETGKTLSSNDFTDIEKNNVAEIPTLKTNIVRLDNTLSHNNYTDFKKADDRIKELFLYSKSGKQHNAELTTWSLSPTLLRILMKDEDVIVLFKDITNPKSNVIYSLEDESYDLQGYIILNSIPTEEETGSSGNPCSFKAYDLSYNGNILEHIISQMKDNFDDIVGTNGGQYTLHNSSRVNYCWNGTKLTDLGNTFKGYILKLNTGSQYTFSDVTNATVWNHLPLNGDTDTLGTINSPFVASENQKYLLLTSNIYTQDNPTISYTPNGLIKNIEETKTDIQNLHNEIEKIQNLTANAETISNQSVPIISFVYDDNSSHDSELIALADERNIKITLSTIGSIEPFDSLGNRLKEWSRKGHCTVSHGCVSGIKDVHGNNLVASDGPRFKCDEDVIKMYEGNIAALDRYGLSHLGITYFNIYDDNPRLRTITSKYYKYGLGGIEDRSGYNDSTRDFYTLSRFDTDSPNMVQNAKTLIDSALGKNVWIILGGHMDRTGRGGSYSTMQDLIEILDYVKEKLNTNQLISLNTDDAYLEYSKRIVAQNCILTHKIDSYPNKIPEKNSIVLTSEGLKYCTDSGNKAIFRLTVSGTSSQGEIKLNFPSNSGSLSDIVTINITDTMSVDEAIKEISYCVPLTFNVVKGSGYVDFYRGVPQECQIPIVSSNTTSLNLLFSVIKEGSNPVIV